MMETFRSMVPVMCLTPITPAKHFDCAASVGLANTGTL